MLKKIFQIFTFILIFTEFSSSEEIHTNMKEAMSSNIKTYIAKKKLNKKFKFISVSQTILSKKNTTNQIDLMQEAFEKAFIKSQSKYILYKAGKTKFRGSVCTQENKKKISKALNNLSGLYVIKTFSMEDKYNVYISVITVYSAKMKNKYQNSLTTYNKNYLTKYDFLKDIDLTKKFGFEMRFDKGKRPYILSYGQGIYDKNSTSMDHKAGASYAYQRASVNAKYNISMLIRILMLSKNSLRLSEDISNSLDLGNKTSTIRVIENILSKYYRTYSDSNIGKYKIVKRSKKTLLNREIIYGSVIRWNLSELKKFKDPKQISVILFDGFETLDVFGPIEVLGSFNDRFEIKYYSLEGGKVTSSQNVIIQTEKISNVKKDNFILFIPGGTGVRRLLNNHILISSLREIANNSKYVLNVCTGSTLFSRTGLLDNRKATSNKLVLQWTKNTSPNVVWIDEARWVKDDNFYTSSGVSAGTDMTLGFISDILGYSVAKQKSIEMEYNWNEDSRSDPFANMELP